MLLILSILTETPLVTEVKKRVRIHESIETLTRDVCAGLELGGHRRIHGNHDLLLLGHERVALFDLLVDPVLEGLPEHSCTDVD